MRDLSSKKQRLRAIGLMSGTSMDGVDAAMVETDGDTIFAFGPVTTLPYDQVFREQLRSIVGRPPDGAPKSLEIIREMTERHVAAVQTLIKQAGMVAGDIDILGFHGQTVFHAPDDAITCQVGDAQLLAAETGIDVVADFRAADVAAGGEGAPLAPVYHVALSRTLERPVAILNIGGVANVTWVSPDGGAVAFDTGPGNALIDDWVSRHSEASHDENGQLARRGVVNQEIVENLMTHPYFAQAVPKSLDRDSFADALARLEGVSLDDGAATLTAFTAASIAGATAHLPATPLRWLVTGGGRHNPAIMAALRGCLAAPVEPVEAVGWDGDALEAQAFGFLAARTLHGLPLTYPQTTGVDKPTLGGRVYSVLEP
jgi:anhydro-N-acetylmuramic acid kinase